MFYNTQPGPNALIVVSSGPSQVSAVSGKVSGRQTCWQIILKLQVAGSGQTSWIAALPSLSLSLDPNNNNIVKNSNFMFILLFNNEKLMIFGSFRIIHYQQLRPYEGRGVGAPLLIQTLKVKRKKNWGEEIFSRGDFFPEIVINLPVTFEKLYCKIEPY